MAGDIFTKYGTGVTLCSTGSTQGLQSLASSATLVAGWTSSWIVNSSTSDALWTDIMVSGQIVSASSATITAGMSIQLWAYAAHSATPTLPDLFSAGTEGTAGTATVYDEEIRNSGMRLLWTATIDADNSDIYTIAPVSLAAAFNMLPTHTALFIVQNTCGILHSSRNALYYIPSKLQYS